ncbi:MAG: 50S ribosomal protein L29 [Prochlorotrichaceae cyanobacterium]|jgi:large subunit ribosomal protein L29
MALSKIKDFRDLSDEELQAKILEGKRELFQLRFQQATRQMSTGTHLFKHIRHRLAQLMTLERERQLAIVPGTLQGTSLETPIEDSSGS